MAYNAFSRLLRTKKAYFNAQVFMVSPNPHSASSFQIGRGPWTCLRQWTMATDSFDCSKLAQFLVRDFIPNPMEAEQPFQEDQEVMAEKCTN